MNWTNYAGEISNLLGLNNQPVSITYSMKPPTRDGHHSKHRVCDALLEASSGETIDLTVETCGCPGGTWHIGLESYPGGEKDKVQKDFLVNREKIFCSIAASHRTRALTVPPPRGLADHVVLSPLGQAEFRPDAVLFICNPEQACRLVTLESYETGIFPKVEMAGSTCYQAVTYPVVSGEINVSLMDYTSRHIPGFHPEDLIVTIPYHRFLNVMRSIDECSAGRAKITIPQSVLVNLSANYEVAVPVASTFRRLDDWSKRLLRPFRENGKRR